MLTYKPTLMTVDQDYAMKYNANEKESGQADSNTVDQHCARD
jgi:hypothetical protein